MAIDSSPPSTSTLGSIRQFYRNRSRSKRRPPPLKRSRSSSLSSKVKSVLAPPLPSPKNPSTRPSSSSSGESSLPSTPRDLGLPQSLPQETLLLPASRSLKGRRPSISLSIYSQESAAYTPGPRESYLNLDSSPESSDSESPYDRRNSWSSSRRGRSRSSTYSIDTVTVTASPTLTSPTMAIHFPGIRRRKSDASEQNEDSQEQSEDSPRTRQHNNLGKAGALLGISAEQVVHAQVQPPKESAVSTTPPAHDHSSLSRKISKTSMARRTAKLSMFKRPSTPVSFDAPPPTPPPHAPETIEASDPKLEQIELLRSQAGNASDEHTMQLLTQIRDLELSLFKALPLRWLGDLRPGAVGFVSQHTAEDVPYPLGYDKSETQAERANSRFLYQLFEGRPTLFDYEGSLKGPPEVVLDIGCGSGTWILSAAQHWPSTVFYGLDVQPTHPTTFDARIRWTAGNFLTAPLPYQDAKFDLVRMAHLKWAVPQRKWAGLLAEVARVLKEGGRVELIEDEDTGGAQGTLPERFCAAKLRRRTEALLAARGMALNVSPPLGDHFMLMPHCTEGDPAAGRAFRLGVAKVQRAKRESVELPEKAAKLMGLQEPQPPRATGRARSGSASSSVTLADTDRKSVSSHRSSMSDVTIPKHAHAQDPHGFELLPSGSTVRRFIPVPRADHLPSLACFSLKSMLGCREAIRRHSFGDAPPPPEWDDAFWDCESTLASRLGLASAQWDDDDDDKLLSPVDEDGSSRAASPVLPVLVQPEEVVRVVRVWEGWKTKEYMAPLYTPRASDGHGGKPLPRTPEYFGSDSE